MIIISPFYTKKSYTKEAVSTYIGQNYPAFKYYGYYERKNYTPLWVYRFYTVLSNGQKKLYLLSPHFFLCVKGSPFNTFSICCITIAGTS